jgi:hypothetical protein
MRLPNDAGLRAIEIIALRVTVTDSRAPHQRILQVELDVFPILHVNDLKLR